MKKSYIELEIELEQTKQELVLTKKELVATKQDLEKTKNLLKIALDQILLLQQEVDKLKQQLNKNSKNSSKPPSTDQKSNTPDNEKKNRETREGKSRPLFPKDKIDKTIESSTAECLCCKSHDITEIAAEILQQIELPEVKAIITEFILKKYKCQSCGQNFKTDLPDGIPYSAFGPKLMGLISILTGVYHLAKREAIQLIKDLYDIDIGLGSIPNIEERVTNSLESVYQRIHNFILNSTLTKHFDETGWRNNGKRHYVWIATSNEAAIYKLDRHRNQAAFEALTKNQDLSNKKCVTDRYGTYNNISKMHQFCLAHLIREFRNFAQRDGPDKVIGKSLEKLLSKACYFHKKFCDKKITLANRNRQFGKIIKKVEYWLEDGLANGSNEMYGLCERLLDRFDNMWVFSKFTDVEPTNNLAERDLRKLVIWRKKSYGTRSERGKKFVERITSISQTLRKQGKNVLKFIEATIKNFYSNKEPDLINSALGF
jgi:transposase